MHKKIFLTTITLCFILAIIMAFVDSNSTEHKYLTSLMVLVGISAGLFIDPYHGKEYIFPIIVLVLVHHIGGGETLAKVGTPLKEIFNAMNNFFIPLVIVACFKELYNLYRLEVEK